MLPRWSSPPFGNYPPYHYLHPHHHCPILACVQLPEMQLPTAALPSQCKASLPKNSIYFHFLSDSIPVATRGWWRYQHSPLCFWALCRIKVTKHSVIWHRLWHIPPPNQYAAFLSLHWRREGQASVSLGCGMDTGKDLNELSSGTTQLAHSWAKEPSTVSEGTSKIGSCG